MDPQSSAESFLACSPDHFHGGYVESNSTTILYTQKGKGFLSVELIVKTGISFSRLDSRAKDRDCIY